MLYRIKVSLRKKQWYHSLSRKKRKILQAIKSLICNGKRKRSIRIWRLLHPKGVFLVLTPVHGNIGDHAIAMSELELIKQYGMKCFEIPGEQLFYLEKEGKLSLMNGRPILINGGGYLGTLWYHDERVVRNVILSNPDSEILLFPNTVYYEDSDWGHEEYEKAKKIYHSHTHLKIYAREQTSLQLMRELCDNVALAPDMVMRLHTDDAVERERTGCLLCLRHDKEKTMTDEMTSAVIKQVEQLFDRVELIDTVLPYGVPIDKRGTEVNKLLTQISTAEMVITDRLHGMIFCAITGTPCIVINSKSPKVLGCYEWLKHLQYIRVCSNVNSIGSLIRSMPSGQQKYDNRDLMKYFDELIGDLKRIGGGNGK